MKPCMRGRWSCTLNTRNVGAILARAMLPVLVSTSFAICQDDDSPGTPRDRGPRLKSSLDSFRKSVKSSNYAGRVVIDLTVTETGEVQDSKIATPTRVDQTRHN